MQINLSGFYAWLAEPKSCREIEDERLLGQIKQLWIESNSLLYAFDSNTGEIIWQFDTNKSFATINGVPAHGGALDIAGSVIAHSHRALSYISQMQGLY